MKLIELLVLVVAVVFSPVSQANEDSCLADLNGVFYSHENGGALQAELAVRGSGKEWTMSMPPDDNRPRRDYFFGSYFSSGEDVAISAVPIKEDDLPLVTRLMLFPFFDDKEEMAGVKGLCGLMTDDIYVLRVDISEADSSFLITMEKELGVKLLNESKVLSAKQERVAYFLGQRFFLDGVYDGILGQPMSKVHSKEWRENLY